MGFDSDGGGRRGRQGNLDSDGGDQGRMGARAMIAVAALALSVTLSWLAVVFGMPMGWATLLIDALIAVVCLWGERRIVGTPVPGGLSATSPALWVALAAALFVVWFFGQLAGQWFISLGDMAYASYEGDLAALDAFLLVVLMLVVAPISEEALFRGVVMGEASRAWGVFWGIVTETVVFVAFHGTLTHVVPTLLVGLLLGCVTSATGRLWPSMVLHSANNALACWAMGLFAPFPAWVGSPAFWGVGCAVSCGLLLAWAEALGRQWEARKAELAELKEAFSGARRLGVSSIRSVAVDTDSLDVDEADLAEIEGELGSFEERPQGPVASAPEGPEGLS